MHNKYYIIPRNPAHSILIQLELFKMGYVWEHYDDQVARYSTCKYLTIKNDGNTGLIDWDICTNGLSEVTFERGVWAVKHYLEQVVPSRNKFRDEMELNGGMLNNFYLNQYRKNRNNTDWRGNRSLEQLCEYILYLEEKARLNV